MLGLIDGNNLDTSVADYETKVTEGEFKPYGEEMDQPDEGVTDEVKQPGLLVAEQVLTAMNVSNLREDNISLLH